MASFIIQGSINQNTNYYSVYGCSTSSICFSIAQNGVFFAALLLDFISSLGLYDNFSTFYYCSLTTFISAQRLTRVRVGQYLDRRPLGKTKAGYTGNLKTTCQKAMTDHFYIDAKVTMNMSKRSRGIKLKKETLKSKIIVFK